MARRNKYLGRRVRDVGRPGLSSLKEVKGIANAVVRDFRRGRISRKTATARLNLLVLISKKLIRKRRVRFKLDTVRSIVGKARKKLKPKRGRRAK